MGACCSSKHAGAPRSSPNGRQAGGDEKSAYVVDADWPEGNDDDGAIVLPSRKYASSIKLNEVSESTQVADSTVGSIESKGELTPPTMPRTPSPMGASVSLQAISAGKSFQENLDIIDSFFDQCRAGSFEAQELTERILREAEELVHHEYDILLARVLFQGAQDVLDEEQWQTAIVASEVYQSFLHKIGFLHRVRDSVSTRSEGWFNVYGNGGAQRIEGCIDKKDATVLHYCVTVSIPARLTNALALGNELDLLTKWNSLITGVPSTIGRRTAHYAIVNYQMAFLAGMYKFDVLNEVRRFSDIEGGYLAEYIESADSTHPCYKQPGSGFKRPKTELKNLWVACGEQHSLLIQVGKVKLPFTATTWLATTIGGLAGRFIVDGLINNSKRTTEPGNPWEGALRQDEHGLYRRLEECVRSEASCFRAPKNGEQPAALKEAELAALLNRSSDLGLRQRPRKNSPSAQVEDFIEVDEIVEVHV
mmetsp:Transcript_1175/g.3118  ORF Transcript_1175/g.3118 Transcript_1175/m.3118 type:complete len:478 (+) Transcript_1175:69-1502(+)